MEKIILLSQFSSSIKWVPEMKCKASGLAGSALYLLSHLAALPPFLSPPLPHSPSPFLFFILSMMGFHCIVPLSGWSKAPVLQTFSPYLSLHKQQALRDTKLSSTIPSFFNFLLFVFIWLFTVKTNKKRLKNHFQKDGRRAD